MSDSGMRPIADMERVVNREANHTAPAQDAAATRPGLSPSDRAKVAAYIVGPGKGARFACSLRYMIAEAVAIRSGIIGASSDMLDDIDSMLSRAGKPPELVTSGRQMVWTCQL